MRVHVLGPAVIDQPGQIAEPDVLAPHAQLHQHVEAGDPRSAAAGRDDLDLGKGLVRHAQRIGCGGANDDGSAVLVIMKDRYVHPRAAQLFDDETVRRLDVLEVDRAKGRLQRADDIGELVRIGLVQLDIETVDIGEFLEEHRLALHHRLGGQRADVAQPQHGRPVGDDRHEVAPRGIVTRGLRAGLDLETGFGHAG